MKRGTRKQWQQRVARWRRSGQTAREFSAAEGLHPSTLRWWSSALKREAPRAEFIEVAVPAVAPAPAVSTIEVLIRDQVRMRVCGEFDPALLRRVVAALEDR
jgi:lambda repressor-like predicted transcriptional regulator